MDESVRSVVDSDDVARPARTNVEFSQMLVVELPRVQRIARLMVGDADAAEEVVAEAVARMLPRWRADAIDDCGAYLRRVVVNLARRRWRRLALARRRDHRALDWMAVASIESSEVVDERDRTLRSVMRLPLRRRAVVVLRFYDDLTEADIARVLGINVGTVKSQLARALEQLRVSLGTLDN
jgi:RNA polymerase sigma factor (sigma-70 family)